MDRIVMDPAVMGGVRGTQIPVTVIAGLLAENVTSKRCWSRIRS